MTDAPDSAPPSRTSFITELRRRNVVRTAIAYAMVGFILLQLAEITFPALRLPDWALTLVVVLVIGLFPLVLILAWAFEITPEGIERSHDVDPNVSITSRTGRWLSGLTVVLAALAAILWWINLDGTPTPGTDPTSVAVLPFASLSEDTADALFADGLTEEILNTLSGNVGLRVAGRTSSFLYRNPDRDLRSIAGDLGVAHVLEGSVRRSGERVRISASLVDAADGFQRWGASYDKTLADVFAVQNEIAAAVADALDAALVAPADDAAADQGVAPEPPGGAAYALYLQAVAELAPRTVAGIQQAANLLENALAEEPNFTLAMVQLAKVELLKIGYELVLDDEEATTILRADQLLGQARHLGDDSAQWWAVRGHYIQSRSRWLGVLSPPEEHAAYEAALARGGSSSYLRNLYANSLVVSDPDRAIAMLQEAHRLDPLNLLPVRSLAGALDLQGRTDEAIALLERFSDRRPGTRADADLAALYFDLSNYSAALEAYYRYADLWTDTDAVMEVTDVWLHLGEIEREQQGWQRWRPAADSPEVRAVHRDWLVLVGHIRRGDLQAAKAFADQSQALVFGAQVYNGLRQHVAELHALVGDHAAALDIQSQGLELDALGSPAQALPHFRYRLQLYAVLHKADLYRRAGDQAEARRLALWLRELMGLLRARGVLPQARVSEDLGVMALLGEREQALATARAWVEQGNVKRFIADQSYGVPGHPTPMMGGLTTWPEFAPLQAQIDAHVARERAEALAVLAGR